jgi:uncharacterized protein (TIGR02001 family)
MTSTCSFKVLSTAALAVVLAAPLTAQAQLAFNVGATTDYRYRGISQSRLKPALQAGVDYAAGPVYVGGWISTIQWIKDWGGNAKVEIDLYGGYKGEIVKDLTYDVGGLYYLYPSNKMSTAQGPSFVNANTFELYGALTYQIYTVKYSHALTNAFANPNSKNSGYLDVSAAFDIGGGLTLTPHLGYQRITGDYSVAGTYKDASLTISKDFSGIVPSAAFFVTDADKANYASPRNGKFLGRSGVAVSVKYNF